jgi:hypothetical protein
MSRRLLRTWHVPDATVRAGGIFRCAKGQIGQIGETTNR